MYDSREIATAALFLAAKMHDFELPDGKGRNERGERLKAWHELFGCDLKRITEIGNRILDIYDVETEQSNGVKKEIKMEEKVAK